MSRSEALLEHRWRSAEFPLCVVNVTAADLSTRLGAPLNRWSEDGLGPARGFMRRLPSGLVLVVQELEHATNHLGAKGPTIYVEAVELVARGIGHTISEVLVGLGLSHENLDWSQTESGLEAARQIVRDMQGRHQA